MLGQLPPLTLPDREMAAILQAISAQVPDRFACIGLALNLDVKDEDLVRLEGTRDGDYSTHTCNRMLHAWWSTQPTNGKLILCHALCSIGLAAIANEFKAALYSGGKLI